MASHCLDKATKLIVSGGDDGSLAVLLTGGTLPNTVFTTPPLLLSRAHASAVTACTVLTQKDRIFILTCGNDQWIRSWEVCIHNGGSTVDMLRFSKMKTNVADVSSMAVLQTKEGEAGAKVLICGVGMEVVSVEWDS
jgi:hypothetical protein